MPKKVLTHDNIAMNCNVNVMLFFLESLDHNDLVEDWAVPNKKAARILTPESPALVASKIESGNLAKSC